MFSGIVETIGVVKQLIQRNDCLEINIMPEKKFSDIRIGDSVSVNGVCLTITDYSDVAFDAVVVPETMRLTNLGQLRMGDPVNLERALTLADRIGGHYVQGHIDGMGEIIDVYPDGKNASILKIRVSKNIAKYIVKKGYVAVDGKSLTVVDVVGTDFTITLIPHTKKVSIAKNYGIGHNVNIEVDILSKYVEKLLQGSSV